MKTSMNDLFKSIVEIITPATGIMATAILKHNCVKLNLNPDKLTEKDVTKLIPKIEDGVKFFAQNPKIAQKTLDGLRNKFSIK